MNQRHYVLKAAKAYGVKASPKQLIGEVAGLNRAVQVLAANGRGKSGNAQEFYTMGEIAPLLKRAVGIQNQMQNLPTQQYRNWAQNIFFCIQALRRAQAAIGRGDHVVDAYGYMKDAVLELKLLEQVFRANL